MKKFFIVGCPRSGTTMVQQALNRHSQVVIPPETKFFFSFFGHSHKQQLRHLDRLDADLNINLARPASRVQTLDEGRAVYEDMARQYVAGRGKPAVYFGEKTPEHSGRLPAIREMFPGAKILVLHRDGRDVASSLSRMPWASPNVYVNFLVWLYYNHAVRGAGVHSCPDVHFARYEAIVADPERELGAILRFLELPYEPAVAQGCGNSEGVPEREYAWKGRTLQKIGTDRVGAFRSELSENQIAAVERLGRHALPAMGYPLITDGCGALSARFLLKLFLEMSKFVYRLPWAAVWKEMLGHSLWRDALAQIRARFGSPEPLARPGQEFLFGGPCLLSDSRA